MNQKIWLILLVGIIFLIYFSPYLVLGKNIHLPLRDNLHQINQLGVFAGKMQAPLFPWQQASDFTLPNSADIFHYAHPKLDKLFYSFSYFWGYFMNETLIRALAFWGFFLLTGLLKIKQNFVRILLALSFATLPFWPQGNITIAGLPFLIYFYDWIFKDKHFKWALVFISFYAIYSNFFYAGFFIFGLMTISNIYFWKKHYNKKIWVFTGLYLLISILSHWPVFYNLLFLKLPTNRGVQQFDGVSFIIAVKDTVSVFVRNHLLAPSLHSLIILPFTAVTSVIVIWKHKWKFPNFLKLWIPLIMISLIAGFFFYKPFLNIYQKLGLGFNFSRFYILNSFIWFSLFAATIGWVLKSFPRKETLKFLIVLISLQICINGYSYLKPAYTMEPTFKQFFAVEQFEEMKEEFPELKTSRVGCVGIFPAVANYNGLRTIGSFSSYYPQEFKTRFRKIIKPVLDKDHEIRNYFENRGSALYLFVDELGINLFDLENTTTDLSADFNFRELRKEEVDYLISIRKIKNDVKLKLLKKYPSKNNTLYLYKIIEEL